MTSEQVELIRVRIMQEAYDLADRNDSEGYNSVKVMCSEVLKLIQLALSAEREAIGNIILDYAGRDDLSDSDESLLKHLFELNRARGEP